MPLATYLLRLFAMGSSRVVRLLIVEDSPAYLYLIQKAFSHRSGQTQWELRVAKDGGEAVHILFEEEAENSPLPDLVLLDWNLPKVSGSEVLRRVKQHPNLLKIPILVFSSSISSDDIHSAYADHANGYIRKPDDLKALADIVESIETFWTCTAEMPQVVRN